MTDAGGASGADQGQPVVLADHLDLQVLGLLQLRAGTGAGDHQVGLFRDRPGHLGAERLGPRLGLRPAHPFQRAGEHHGLAGDRRIDISRRLDRLDLQRGDQGLHGIAVMRLGEELDQSIALFEEQFQELEDFAPTPEISASLKQVASLWNQYRQLGVRSWQP